MRNIANQKLFTEGLSMNQFTIHKSSMPMLLILLLLLLFFNKALREGKRCVTAHWLNTVLKRKMMVPPHRTLHVPFAFPPGAKPCSQHVCKNVSKNASIKSAFLVYIITLAAYQKIDHRELHFYCVYA